ncbi:hypothetical protein K435DRAFT_797856 [Dendrothele bispora CBS 962.96]|uniref:Uncharacterized protein n=1 Tax=Dendrothele bispora (strain CBS 962.96) TaxID=1314807 RepID=A0A4S8M120_DENBC|nr:hypothetical protein K435DRAFT_797856 [Dendrothele bispora CBS 962.96]
MSSFLVSDRGREDEKGGSTDEEEVAEDEEGEDEKGEDEEGGGEEEVVEEKVYGDIDADEEERHSRDQEKTKKNPIESRELQSQLLLLLLLRGQFHTNRAKFNMRKRPFLSNQELSLQYEGEGRPEDGGLLMLGVDHVEETSKPTTLAKTTQRCKVTFPLRPKGPVTSVTCTHEFETNMVSTPFSPSMINRLITLPRADQEMLVRGDSLGRCNVVVRLETPVYVLHKDDVSKVPNPDIVVTVAPGFPVLVVPQHYHRAHLVFFGVSTLLVVNGHLTPRLMLIP